MVKHEKPSDTEVSEAKHFQQENEDELSAKMVDTGGEVSKPL